MRVPLLDLRAQHDTIRTEIAAALRDVVESQYFVLGPTVDEFERRIAEWIGVDHAIGCASGTDALLLPLMALQPDRELEVIVPAFTFFATAGAVWNAGFRPVFCDVDPETFNVTADSVGEVLTDRTRVVIPVHLFGQMADLPGIQEVVGPDVRVFEDAAQSIGARLERDGRVLNAGAAGWAGAFSFFPTKNLGAFGDAGMITTGNQDLAERLRKLRVHGGRQMYHHEVVGTNSRLDALQAAVLAAKLPHLEHWTESRQRNAALYRQMLADVPEVILPKQSRGATHVYNQFTIRARRRDELAASLKAQGIGSGIYYPKPLHLQECFLELGGRQGQLPASETLCEQVLSLPIYAELGEDQIALVSEAIRAFYGQG